MTVLAPSLNVVLSGQAVGRLERNRNGLTVWHPRPEWEDRGQHPRLGLSFLREPGPRQAGTGLIPWFDNLLPEVGSALRQRLCLAHNIKEVDGFRLLQVIGKDLPGAVEITSSEPLPPLEDSHTLPVTETTQSDTELAGALRFSLAGMQLKLSMSMANERLAVGASGAGSKWIVKLPSPLYPELPEVECTTMTWARNAGFDVPEHFVVRSQDLLGVPASWLEDMPTAFAVKRFDRREDGSKIHQEDLCQALDVPPFQKYQDSGQTRISLDGVVRFVADVSGEDAARELSRRIGFIIASGNNDAHLKNWSLLWGHADRPSLAPCYDFVSTITWSNLFGWDSPQGPSLSLGLGREHQFARLNSFTLDKHVERSQCAWAKDEILAGIERARDAWPSVTSDMPESMHRALSVHWQRVPLLSKMLRV